MHRRNLLQSAGLSLLSIGQHGWAAAADGRPKRLIVILLRGAVDGLNVVVPYAEAAYYQGRGSIAIATPGKPEGALALDGHFGLHPALKDLLPLWTERNLAFIHAAGSPHPTRSHFDAQLYLENGTPGQSTTRDGWMNRLLSVLPGSRGPTDALSIGPLMPQILAGKAAVATLPLGSDGAKPVPLDRPDLAVAFDRLYMADDALGKSYREGRMARAQLLGALRSERQSADNGAPPPAGFPRQAARLGGLIRRDASIRLAAIGLGGWDTHINEGNHKGQLANRLRPLGEGLAALARSSGEAWRDTVVLVMSEFGRTVRENGNGGTDHGHGNVIWVLGGDINGGRIYGEWPGLAPTQLYQKRDLAVTTDFRSALAVVLERHMRLSDAQLAAVLPDIPAPSPALERIIPG
ncbi:MAG: DUF1501 domain-containing protein [Stellaceae bacterium]